MNSEEMREEFEAWAVEELGLPTRRVARGDYQSFGMSMAWKAWRASRAAVVVELPLTRVAQGEKAGDSVPKRSALMANHLAIEECREAIEAAGLKVKQ